MNLRDILMIAWDGVKSRKFRFALNLVGIMIGCAAVTGLISMTGGLSNTVSNQLQIFGPQNIMVVPGQISMRGGPPSIGIIGWKELQIVEKTPHVLAVAPIIGNKYASFSVRGKVYSSQIYGVTEEFQRINKNTELESGRVFESSDTGVCILGGTIAWPRNKDAPILFLGDRITLSAKVSGETRTITVRVIGILKQTGGSFGISLDDSIAIPMRDAQSLYNIGAQYTYLMAQADDLTQVTQIAKDIKARLGTGYMAVSYDTAKSSVEAVTGSISAVLGGIAAISLIVAGVGIINTMTVSVLERTREIGVLKAIGSKSRDILLMFITEAALTGIFGGTLGAALGFGMGQVVGGMVGVLPAISLNTGVMVVGFAIVVSILSGMYPAWRAANLNPVEALRSE